MSVAICFVPDPVPPLPARSIHHRAGYGDALLLYDETLRIVDVGPESVIALADCRYGPGTAWIGYRRLDADVSGPNPTLLTVRSLHTIETVAFRRIEQREHCSRFQKLNGCA